MIQESYQYLVNSGIPAEDARGLLPTNVQTRIHWAVNLRSLKLEAGKRLSTQAQYEWKAVIAGIARAIREYDPNRQLLWQARNMGDRSAELFLQFISGADDWQYEGISDLFRPICYQLGRCQFRAEIDRSCTIRDRVEANFKIGRDSSEWDKPHYGRPENDGGPEYLTIQPIRPEEWLNDPTAAR
jgi:thymidylate synthase ThyX